MNIRTFNKEDYSIVHNWWTKQQWTPVPEDMLSSTGFIVTKDDGEEVAAAWVYITNSPIFLIEWMVGNPDLDWEERQDGINMLLDECSNWCKAHGAGFMLTMTNKDRFIDKLKDNDFKVSDEGKSHLLRRL